MAPVLLALKQQACRSLRRAGKLHDYLDFFGRPAFSGDKAAITLLSFFMSMSLISATPARSNSLFLTATPAFRKAFLTSLKTWYSISGMVKLSRTSLAFLPFTSATGLTNTGAAGFAAGLAALVMRLLAAGLAVGLVAGLAAALVAAFFAGDLVAAGLALTFFATALTAGLAAAFLATAFLAAGALLATAFFAAAFFAAGAFLAAGAFFAAGAFLAGAAFFDGAGAATGAVSYTHLTLPTSDLV